MISIRFAIRNSDGEWLRSSKGFTYSKGRHGVYTADFQHARLYTMRHQAIQYGAQEGDAVIAVECVAQL